MEQALQLFIEKGFQATSIQDILDCSGISKGTFYNYFTSKSELLMNILQWLQERMVAARSEILIGKDLSDRDVFCEQIIIQMQNNKRNELLNLYREIFASNDQELVQFIRHLQLMEIKYVKERLTDICGQEKERYLLDCSIMFAGIVQQNFYFNNLATSYHADTERIIRYSVNRVLEMVDHLAESGEQLLDPSLIDQWLVTGCSRTETPADHFLRIYANLKIFVDKFDENEEKWRTGELLEFVKAEIFAENARVYLIESALAALNNSNNIRSNPVFIDFQEHVRQYLQKASRVAFVGKNND